MKTKINWKNHLIELVVVVIGITIAFMLENWRQESAVREMEEKYIQSFKDDLQHDATTLDSIATAVQNKIYLLQTFISDLKEGNLKRVNAEKVISDMLSNHSFFPKQAVYESIKNSGGMNIISDYEVKEAIVAYYSLNDDLRLKEEVFFDYLQTFVFPFVYRNLDFLSGKIINGPVVTSREFSNIVAGYYTLVRQNFEMYNNYKSANQKLLKIITEND